MWLRQDDYRGTPNDPQSLHRYNYVKQSPTNFWDEYGYYENCSPNDFGCESRNLLESTGQAVTNYVVDSQNFTNNLVTLSFKALGGFGYEVVDNSTFGISSKALNLLGFRLESMPDSFYCGMALGRAFSFLLSGLEMAGGTGMIASSGASIVAGELATAPTFGLAQIGVIGNMQLLGVGTAAVAHGAASGAYALAKKDRLFQNVPSYLQGAKSEVGGQQKPPSISTNKEAKEAARKLGYDKETTYKSHGQKVFQKGNSNSYISRDVDQHNGGVWKMFKLEKGNLVRVGTFDAELNYIGQ